MDIGLVERARNGDRDAFTSIVAANADACYALAYRILRDPQAAQDATQRGLLAAWRDLPSLRDPERFEAWLRKLVIHACYAEARSERRWIGRVRALQLEPEAADAGPDVAGAVVARQALQTGFRALSPEHRAVVVLHHYFGYQLTEIAQTLGIPVGTARSRLHYAVRRLRSELDADRSRTEVKTA